MNTKKVLLLGGSGFVGSYIANRLSSLGIQVTVPTRRRERSKTLLVLPHVEVVEANIHCPETLSGLLQGQDAVINLVGILHSRDVKLPYSADFAEAHVEFPKKLIAAMKSTGVRRLLHMSALKADPQGPSEYLRSKGEGEALVLGAQSALNVTVFRPSVIFGLGDRFLTMFGKLLKTLPIFPLGFAQARFQPVWVADVADAFVDSLEKPETFGQVFELAGPTAYTLGELLALTRQITHSEARILNISEGWAYLLSGLLWLAPKPMQSPDNLRSMAVDNVLDTHPKLLPGFTPKTLESILPTYIGKMAPRARLDIYRFRAGR